MIIDTFMFFNELDILEARMRYLWDVVDYFVIVESNVTHSGKPKRFIFRENQSRFDKYKLKIIYYPYYFDNSLHNLDFSKYDMSYNSANFKFVELQRNHITSAVSRFGKNDIVIVSDVDQIPSKKTIKNIGGILKTDPGYVVLSHQVFHYDLQHKSAKPKQCTVVALNSLVQRVGAHQVKWTQSSVHTEPRILNAGWHLKYFGSINTISEQLKATAKQELNLNDMSSAEFIRAAYANHLNVYGDQWHRFYRPTMDEFQPEFWEHFKQFYTLRND